jgi:hypothetical protein
MRTLMVKQKKFIDKVMSERSINNVGDLTLEEWKTLEKMNDTEILWQEINRYINDKRIESFYGKKI